MSNHATPVLFISLGGEMLYVLDQRLRAQEVVLQKGSRVMGDIVSNMFSNTLVEELFKPQAIYSRKGIGAMFERLVNSSIMRIDSESMEKLFDLMLMTFKYQVIKCQNLADILHIVLNHLDAVLDFVKLKPDAEKLALKGFKTSVLLYENMHPGDLVLIKQSLLGFLHDLKNKVSVLVNRGDQNADGTFVMDKDGVLSSGSDVPGTIHYYDEGRTEYFNVGATFRNSGFGDASTEIGGTRTTDLGINLYGNDIGNISPSKPTSGHPSKQSLADAEVKLLGHLMGTSGSKGSTFKLDVFGYRSEKREGMSAVSAASASVASSHLTIVAEKVTDANLLDIKGDFTDSCQTSDAPDLLSLMDIA